MGGLVRLVGYGKYVFERRREQGWSLRVLGAHVLHAVCRSAIRHVFTDAEIAAAMGRG